MGCQDPQPRAPTSSRTPALQRVSASMLSGNPHSQLHPLLQPGLHRPLRWSFQKLLPARVGPQVLGLQLRALSEARRRWTR